MAPFFHQADVWAALLRHFHFWQVMVIHSADVDGYSLLNRLQTQFQSNDDEGDQREIKVFINIFIKLLFRFCMRLELPATSVVVQACILIPIDTRRTVSFTITMENMALVEKLGWTSIDSDGVTT